MDPVTPARIKAAKDHGIVNAHAAARACRKAGLSFFDACALLEQESFGGQNIYGHDKGGVYANIGRLEVTATNFLEFLIRVVGGSISNGVGPCQITYAGSLRNGHRDGGYFALMAAQNLRPWIPEENMVFGFGLLADAIKRAGDTQNGGARYNGGSQPNADAQRYGRELAAKSAAWRKRFGI